MNVAARAPSSFLCTVCIAVGAPAGPSTLLFWDFAPEQKEIIHVRMHSRKEASGHFKAKSAGSPAEEHLWQQEPKRPHPAQTKLNFAPESETGIQPPPAGGRRRN